MEEIKAYWASQDAEIVGNADKPKFEYEPLNKNDEQSYEKQRSRNATGGNTKGKEAEERAILRCLFDPPIFTGHKRDLNSKLLNISNIKTIPKKLGIKYNEVDIFVIEPCTEYEGYEWQAFGYEIKNDTRMLETGNIFFELYKSNEKLAPYGKVSNAVIKAALAKGDLRRSWFFESKADYLIVIASYGKIKTTRASQEEIEAWHDIQRCYGNTIDRLLTISPILFALKFKFSDLREKLKERIENSNLMQIHLSGDEKVDSRSDRNYSYGIAIPISELLDSFEIYIAPKKNDQETLGEYAAIIANEQSYRINQIGQEIALVQDRQTVLSKEGYYIIPDRLKDEILSYPMLESTNSDSLKQRFDQYFIDTLKIKKVSERVFELHDQQQRILHDQQQRTDSE